jgi:hypothetical protein
VFLVCAAVLLCVLCWQVGVALKPSTPAELVLPYLQQGLLDMVSSNTQLRLQPADQMLRQTVPTLVSVLLAARPRPIQYKQPESPTNTVCLILCLSGSCAATLLTQQPSQPQSPSGRACHVRLEVRVLGSCC